MGTFFTLEVLPSGEGDCLLLHWGPERSIAVIDGGPAKTFETTLAPRLDEIRKKRKAATLELALVMVSHVDNDHIIGIRKLFRELFKDQDAEKPEQDRRFKANRLWLNTFRDILGDAFDGYYTQQATAAVVATAAGNMTSENLKQAGLDNVPAKEVEHLALVLAGHADGRTLRADYEFLFRKDRIMRINMPFGRPNDASPLMLTAPPMKAQIDGLELHVSGPSQAELVKLREDFELFLKKKGLGVPAALLAAAGAQDTSPTNLSSVVCLLKFDGKTILMTGDARGDRILKGLQGAGLRDDRALHVNVLKVPHHGSSHNAGPNFFRSITADTYVISANGNYSNPDRETLEWLIESRKPSDKYEIAFTYPLDAIDQKRKSIHEGKKKVWDPAKHALASLVDAYKQKGFAFTVSNGRKVIDLGDEKLSD